MQIYVFVTVTKYKEYDVQVAKTAFNNLAKTHTIFVHRKQLFHVQEVVIYYLFNDNSIFIDREKHEMARKLFEILQSEFFGTGLPILDKPLDSEAKLSDFLGRGSWFTFYALELNYHWLTEPLSFWPNF